ncbi:hypothetical protein CRM22_008870 [Opisthorchis felineus]|uniref:Uncharacterized protein n=1 Tax=Opisthorchis felineus TaxID=147828 RepID=A0A4S2L990_OPIFE|nr:hypothetical protein CRM22_008870 [Opisthorchis felineus]
MVACHGSNKNAPALTTRQQKYSAACRNHSCALAPSTICIANVYSIRTSTNDLMDEPRSEPEGHCQCYTLSLESKINVSSRALEASVKDTNDWRKVESNMLSKQVFSPLISRPLHRLKGDNFLARRPKIRHVPTSIAVNEHKATLWECFLKDTPSIKQAKAILTSVLLRDDLAKFYVEWFKKRSPGIPVHSPASNVLFCTLEQAPHMRRVFPNVKRPAKD